jgi:hypothetical protein
MAGRGTDIILGGNPEGLAQLALLRLVYRRLAPPAREGSAGPGHEEEDVAAAAAAGALGVPRLPLDVFDPYDAGEGPGGGDWGWGGVGWGGVGWGGVGWGGVGWGGVGWGQEGAASRWT